MSNFQCGQCGTNIIDSPNGYTTGCEHYPLENVAHLPRKKFRLDGEYFSFCGRLTRCDATCRCQEPVEDKTARDPRLPTGCYQTCSVYKRLLEAEEKLARLEDWANMIKERDMRNNRATIDENN